MQKYWNPFDIPPGVINDDDEPSDDDVSVHVSDMESDASSSAPPSEDEEDSPTSSDASSGDDEFQASYRDRKRAGMVTARITTASRDAGFIDADDMRFQVPLRRQHELRAPDRAFCKLKEGVPGHLQSESRWRRWRASNLEHFGLTSKTRLEEVTVERTVPAAADAPARVTKTKITVYKMLVAFVMNVTLLLQLTLMFAAPYADPVIPFLLCGDGVGDASSGMPGKGKVFGLFLKQLSLISPQSPAHLIPLMFAFGSDSASNLAWAYEQAGIGVRLLPRALARTYTIGTGDAATVAGIACAFLGDFPACCSALAMSTAARPFPTTAGRVPLWDAPLCWCCGASAGELYGTVDVARAYRNDRERRAARASGIASRVGVPPSRVFYDPVHGVAVLVQSLLCDIAIYFQRIHTEFLHPVTAYILLLFPSASWDPFLARAHPDRRSKKPFYSNDPAPVWRLIMDQRLMAEFDALLSLHDITWHSIDGATASPRGLWRACLRWVCAFGLGNAADARREADLVEDLWRRMLSLSAPIPPGVPCAYAPRPAFYPAVTAYGPASHAILCTASSYIGWVDRVMPNWRASGHTFLKIGAGIYLENGMRTIRSTLTDFNINTSSRRHRPMLLLERQVEEHLLRRIQPVQSDGMRPHFEPKKYKASFAENSAYAHVPLSLQPLSLPAL